MQPYTNILVVDDDEIVHMLVDKLLAKFSAIGKVYHAYNGAEAFDVMDNQLLTDNHHPSIVLTDLHMPVMNGLDFMSTVVKSGANRTMIRFALISSTTDRTELVKALDLGFDYVLPKPIDHQKLTMILSSISTLVGS